MDEVWVRVLLTILGSAIGSTGMWSFFRNRDTKRAATTRLMMGMARETITTQGLAIIERGYVTKEEFDELDRYFYKPYAALGGNGMAERIMTEVSRLPFSSHSRYSEITRNRDTEGWSRNVRVVSREEADTSSG